MKDRRRRVLACTTAMAVLLMGAFATAVQAQTSTYEIDIGARPLGDALTEYGRRTGRQLFFAEDLVAGRTSTPISGEWEADAALRRMLTGSGLLWRTMPSGALVIEAEDAARPQVGTGVAPSMLDEVVVTGSNIRGVAPVGASLIVLGREAIDQTGAATVSQVLATLPQNHGGGNNEGTVGVPGGSNSNVGFGSSPNLRGLGSSSTLVLMNGRRMAPAAFGQFVDVSQIPLGAVERIEVLPDGASATYGSDAVGGVVNFVMKRRYDGAETTASVGGSTRGDAFEHRFSQTLGRDGGRGGLLLNYEYYHRDALDAADRDYSASPRRLDLLPRQDNHAALVAGRLDVTPKIEAWVTGLGSVRKARQRTVYGQPVPETVQGSVTGGLDFVLSQTWSGSASALIGRSRSSYDSPAAGGARLDVRSDVWSLDVQADGGLFDLPGGLAKLAVGASLRGDQFENVGGGERAADRQVRAAFVEAHLPLVSAANARPGVERLEVSLAARHEHYSDFGDTTNPKAGVLWSPSTGLTFRASYGTAFRAPLLNDLSTAPNATILIDLPNPAAAAGASLVMFQQGGNPDLGPEEATTLSLGVELEPRLAPGLRASLGYFDIDYRDRIATAAPGGEILGILSRSSVYPRQLTGSPTEAQVLAYQSASPQFINLHGPFVTSDVDFLFDRRLNNLSRQRVRGLDGALDYRLTLDSGEWSASLATTYLLQFEDQVSDDAPGVSTLATAYRQPRLRARAVFGWGLGDWSASATLNYTSKLFDRSVTPVAVVKPWTTLDAQVAYQAEPSGLRIALSIRNLLDEDPPYLRSPLALYAEGYDPTNANPLGRYVSLAVTKRW